MPYNLLVSYILYALQVYLWVTSKFVKSWNHPCIYLCWGWNLKSHFMRTHHVRVNKCENTRKCITMKVNNNSTCDFFVSIVFVWRMHVPVYNHGRAVPWCKVVVTSPRYRCMCIGTTCERRSLENVSHVFDRHRFLKQWLLEINSKRREQLVCLKVFWEYRLRGARTRRFNTKHVKLFRCGVVRLQHCCVYTYLSIETVI